MMKDKKQIDKIEKWSEDYFLATGQGIKYSFASSELGIPEAQIRKWIGAYCFGGRFGEQKYIKVYNRSIFYPLCQDKALVEKYCNAYEKKAKHDSKLQAKSILLYKDGNTSNFGPTRAVPIFTTNIRQGLKSYLELIPKRTKSIEVDDGKFKSKDNKVFKILGIFLGENIPELQQHIKENAKFITWSQTSIYNFAYLYYLNINKFDDTYNSVSATHENYVENFLQSLDLINITSIESLYQDYLKPNFYSKWNKKVLFYRFFRGCIGFEKEISNQHIDKILKKTGQSKTAAQNNFNHEKYAIILISLIHIILKKEKVSSSVKEVQKLIDELKKSITSFESDDWEYLFLETKKSDNKNIVVNGTKINLVEVRIKPKKTKKQSKTTIRKPRSKEEALEMAEKSIDNGNKGQDLVYEYEYQKLVSADREDLAKQIEKTWLKNENAGYDIKSFSLEHKTPKEILIEVKSVQKLDPCHFFISDSELEKVKKGKTVIYAASILSGEISIYKQEHVLDLMNNNRISPQTWKVSN